MPKLLWEENDATKAAHQRLVAQIVQLIVTSPGGINDRLFLLESVVTAVLQTEWQKHPKLGLSILAGQVEGRLDIIMDAANWNDKPARERRDGDKPDDAR
jgi:hypothetical protein